MSIINSFLQKRKMHENHHGIVMVITAYVLSFLMLVLGSDVFYNINTAAAGTNMDTDEETQEMLSMEPLDLQKVNFAKKMMLTTLIDPYGLDNSLDANLVGASVDQRMTNEDTIWLLGSAMESEEYSSLLEQMNGLDFITNEDRAVNEAEIKKADKTTVKTVKEKGNTIENLSLKKVDPTVAATKDEIQMLERIVEAEASGEDMRGKILIANVILNRRSDEEFPDSIKGVIFQKVSGDYQFSPISDERYWAVKVSKDTKEAVQRAIEGEDYSKGALFFMARRRTNSSNAKWFDRQLDWLFKHGGHEFYKNK